LIKSWIKSQLKRQGRLKVLAEEMAFLKIEGDGGRGSGEGKLSYKILSTNAK